MAAVSALKIFLFIFKDFTFFRSRISFLSFSEKSPSGPIKMHTGLSLFILI